MIYFMLNNMCAIGVSSKSCATCKSSLVETSEFPARKRGSCISFLIIYYSFHFNICAKYKNVDTKPKANSPIEQDATIKHHLPESGIVLSTEEQY